MTHVVSFIGSVSPEAGNWWIEDRIGFQHGRETIVLHVSQSVFNVQVTTTDDDPIEAEWVRALWQRTQAIVRAVLDSLGFHLGAPLDVRLLSGTVNNGDGLFYSPIRHEAFSSLGEGGDVPGELLQPYIRGAAAHPAVRHALADIREAMRLGEDTAFYCYRAIESMRQHFVPDNKERDDTARTASWDELRAVLGVGRDPIDEIRREADARRHGRNVDLLDIDQLVEFVKRTRQWVDQFVQHLNTSIPTAASDSEQRPSPSDGEEVGGYETRQGHQG